MSKIYSRLGKKEDDTTKRYDVLYCNYDFVRSTRFSFSIWITPITAAVWITLVICLMFVTVIMVLKEITSEKPARFQKGNIKSSIGSCLFAIYSIFLKEEVNDNMPPIIFTVLSFTSLIALAEYEFFVTAELVVPNLPLPINTLPQCFDRNEKFRFVSSKFETKRIEMASYFVSKTSKRNVLETKSNPVSFRRNEIGSRFVSNFAKRNEIFRIIKERYILGAGYKLHSTLTPNGFNYATAHELLQKEFGSMKISLYLNSSLIEVNITWAEDIVKQFSKQRSTFAWLIKVDSNQFAPMLHKVVDGAHLRKRYYCHLASNVVGKVVILDIIKVAIAPRIINVAGRLREAGFYELWEKWESFAKDMHYSLKYEHSESQRNDKQGHFISFTNLLSFVIVVTGLFGLFVVPGLIFLERNE
ncbi:hypothetical protein Fcan01_23818 [Folsomia candida]|uniref:Uncharacterized protein n=1 Tax=Folsomia candida TaxID=158441 RepID=A0A226D8J0_FOLCA|nr:hypothetical protein Fcan01_23818 [Folsomia candida]